MKKWLTIFIITSLVACQRNQADRTQVESRLKDAMKDYLYKEINYDSSKATYNVLDVNYFEDKTFFECEFHVRMKSKNLDTTGIMTARISKDFSKVKRKS